MTSQSTRTTYRQIAVAFVVFRLVAFFSASPLAFAKAGDTGTVSAAATSARLEQFPPQQFLDLTNAVRQTYGVLPLTLDDQLNAAAQAKAQDMVDKGYWAHFRPGDNKAPWDFISEAGYSYHVAGENLAKGFRSPEGITQAWVASPTHLANLVSPKYSNVGYASVMSTDSDGSSVLLTVEMFGHK
ncbi:MAG: CAP domain-containing protein [bacterium]